MNFLCTCICTVCTVCTVYMYCLCTVYALYVLCICTVYALYVLCICTVYALCICTVYMDCVYVLYSVCFLAAAAKMGDTVESHETQVVTLNKQLAGKCVEFLEQSKELTRLKEQLSSLQTEVTRLRRQEEELVIQLGSLSEKVRCTDPPA